MYLSASYALENPYFSDLLIDITGQVKLPTADERRGLGTGKFDFAHLVLIEPTVIVEFDKNGTSNFSFDTAGEKQGETRLPPPPFLVCHCKVHVFYFHLSWE